METQRPKRGEARQHILETALELFYQRGVRCVGVDEIVARAGVTKMTLYKHFPSKDDLIAEFLRLRDQRWMHWFVTTVEARATEPRAKLLALFDALEEWTESPTYRGCAFINCAVELADPEHPGFAIAVEHKRALQDYVRGIATEAGFANPEALAFQLFLLIEGAIVVAQMGTGPAVPSARAAAEALIAQHEQTAT